MSAEPHQLLASEERANEVLAASLRALDAGQAPYHPLCRAEHSHF